MKIDNARIQKSLQPSPAAQAAIGHLLQGAGKGGATPIIYQVREGLVLDEMVIFECVNEAIASLDLHRAELFKRMLSSSPDFGNAIKRVTIDIGVLLSLATTFESDDAFVQSAGILHDINFMAYDGKLADYALLLIEADMRAAQEARDGSPSADAILYELVPYDVIKRRLQVLHSFIKITAGREQAH